MVVWVLGGSMVSRVLHHAVIRLGQHPAVPADANVQGRAAAWPEDQMGNTQQDSEAALPAKA